MPELKRLRPDDERAVLDFERNNRAWFARSISDRGEEFFEHFTERFRDLIADQESGGGAYHLLVGDDGRDDRDDAVLGRFNLVFVADGVADVGYRMAEHASGRGLATAAVRDLCGLAATRYGVHLLRAATSEANIASQRVLEKAGFVTVGPADPADVGGKPGRWYELEPSRSRH